MKKSCLLSAILVTLFSCNLSAQAPKKPHIGEIQQMLEKLEVLGTVLHVAAHPDDENTSLITYFANEEHMRTAYLSATRGDGGQNLIGPEIREELGLIRTQELLAARRTDGGQQFFSRANDFGYSKHPDETFTIWDREKVLADFVWVFRKFRPDIVITRSSREPGVTHGHHTAAAILAEEAFKLSGNPSAYPEQLDLVDAWQPSKLFWNRSWWSFRNTGEKPDTTTLTQINVGKYNPLLGKSYTEISSLSRSMHRSQGFGSTGRRGDAIDYLFQLDGEETDEIFDNIETSWARVSGGEEVAFLVQKMMEDFNPSNPSELLPTLLLTRRAINKIEEEFWKEVKLREVDDLIKAVSGLYAELVASQSSYVPGDSIQISVEMVNRSSTTMKVERVKLDQWINGFELSSPLGNNKKFSASLNLKLPAGIPFSTPYWLREESSLGMYTVEDQEQRGKPENDPSLSGSITVSIGGEEFSLNVPVVFKRNDPVDGEVYEPVAISPPVMANLSSKVLVFGDGNSKKVDVRVIAGKKNVSGELSLDAPKGWRISPEAINYSLEQKGQEQIYSFEITPPKKASDGNISISLTYEGKTYQNGFSEISYDHFPKQNIYPKANARVVRLDLEKRGDLIGYIEGAGDAIPENLTQIGYTVEFLEKDDVNLENLKKYDAVILGIRALNTVKWLAYKNTELFRYVREGGTLINQYNTSHRLVTQDIAPFDLKLSRDRVTVEGAPVEILAKEHPAIAGPNKITDLDFEHWVQERGLYFPNEWSDEFTPILSSNDPGETPKKGGLLVAQYGEGHYVYSGYSWFRNLPAGVPGAYRLFVNLISLGND
ncbi:MAG: PIG-L family deacetylase [Cyclobacteriaceae bacterium]